MRLTLVIMGKIKYNIWIVFLLVAVSSCTKTDNPDPVSPPPLVDGPVKSLTVYSPGNRTRTVQLFTYDQQQMLRSMRQYVYDSSFDAVMDSLSVMIGEWGTGKPPSYYDVLYQYHWAPEGGLAEHHVLSYDNQNRIIRDSISAGNNGNNDNAVLFTYDDVHGSVMGKNIYYVSGVPPEAQVNETDTFIIESDNVIFDERYGQFQTFAYNQNPVFSSYINPLYNEFLARTMGLALVFHQYGNFRNKNLPDHTLLIDRGFNASNFHYRWTTDAKDRVVNGLGEAAGFHDELTYTY